MSKTQTQEHKHNTRKQPEMTRRKMIKTVGVGAGAAAVGTGAVGNTGFTQTAQAQSLTDKGLITVGAGFAGLKMIDNFLGGSDVDEDLNSETYVYQITNTIADLRSGPTGDRTEIEQDFSKPPKGQSAYAQAAGSEIVAETALATLEGNSDQAQNRAQEALDKQTTRSLINLFEMWNATTARLVESGALIEEYEQNLGVLKIHIDGIGKQPLDTVKPGDSQFTGVETTSPEGEDGYLALKTEIPASNLPVDPTSLEGRENPLEVYGIVHKDNSPYLNVPVRYFDESTNGYSVDWFDQFYPVQGSDGNLMVYDDRSVVATHNGDTVRALDAVIFRKAIEQIAKEYEQIQSNLSSVVDSTVQGLEQGTISPTEVLSGRDLVTKYDPNNRRGQLHREAMAMGMEMPGEPQFQALISHPELEADELWADLFLRLDTGNDLNVDGPMTIPASDYSSAWIGYTGDVSNEYKHQVLRSEDDSGSGQDLQILEIETPDQNVVDSGVTVGANGKVRLAPEDSESTPTPLKEPDPKYDKWGITVQAADGSTDSKTVADAYLEDGTWYLDTSLSEGLTVEELRYTPPSTYNNTSLWTPGGTTYDVQTAETTIEYRRKINEAIEEEFNSVLGGGGGLFSGFPTLPGLGVIESIVVVIVGIFGLNALSS